MRCVVQRVTEASVTVDGETRSLARPFFVAATQNPVETLGCFPLPEAQLDRFFMKISMGDLSAEEERQMIDRFITAEPLEELEAVASAEDLIALQKRTREVYVHPDLRKYMAARAQNQADFRIRDPRGSEPPRYAGAAPRGPGLRPAPRQGLRRAGRHKRCGRPCAGPPAPGRRRI